MKKNEDLTKEQQKAIKLFKDKKYHEKINDIKAWEIIERDNLYKFVGIEEDKPLWQ